MSLVVLGEVMVDVVARVADPLARGSDTPADISFAGGGSGANVAAWAAWLGAPVVLITRVGDDERGRAAVAGLRNGGVDVRATVDPDQPTGTCIVLVEPAGERTMVPDPGANDGPYEPPAGGTHLHVSGYALLRAGSRPSALAAIEHARAAGMTVSVDPASWALLDQGAIPDADLLLPNDEEASVLAPRRDLVGTARALVEGGAEIRVAAREVVVKVGPAGALWTDGRDVVRVPAEPATVVDTTGAGDAFAAGLLTARLNGAGPREALEAGCRTAARAVAQVGARPRL